MGELRAEGEGFEFARPGGEYVVSSLMKQKIKAKNYAVSCFAGKRNFFFYIYDVITWEKFQKRSSIHYLDK
jgi:hypothetical protein